MSMRRVMSAGPDTAPLRSLLVHGEAVRSLEALLKDDKFRPQFANEVAACYIDPPFNTGETFGQYDDSLGQDEWQRLMREGLELATRFLRSDGSIWVHLDDSMQHLGRCLMDEIFGRNAFVATLIWQRRTTRDNRTAFSVMHDYIHIYSPAGAKIWKKRRNPLPDHGTFANPDSDPRGPWRSVPLSVQAGHATASQFYTIVTPTGARHDPPPGRCWAYSRDRLRQLDAEGRIYWPRGGDGKPRLKHYQTEAEGLAPFSIWFADEVGTTGSAKKDLLALHSGKVRFDTPKPEQLLERVIKVATNPGETIMDFFLGSGTTAAVAIKTGRRWLGIEQNRKTLSSCTVPRLRAVLEGRDGIGIKPVADLDKAAFDFLAM